MRFLFYHKQGPRPRPHPRLGLGAWEVSHRQRCDSCGEGGRGRGGMGGRVGPAKTSHERESVARDGLAVTGRQLGIQGPSFRIRVTPGLARPSTNRQTGVYRYVPVCAGMCGGGGFGAGGGGGDSSGNCNCNGGGGSNSNSSG